MTQPQIKTQATSYKQWQSPILLEDVFASASAPSYLQAEGQCLFWMEQNASKGGITELKYCDVSATSDGVNKTLSPVGYNVRTRANEYGGRAYVVKEGAKGNIVYFCNDKDQRIYKALAGEREGNETHTVFAITPDYEAKGLAQNMFADMCVSSDGQWLFAVMETPAEPENITQIVAINTKPNISHIESPKVLVSGSDFYSSLSLSSDNSELAWVEWKHPNMPWDRTHVAISTLDW